ncbi:glycoside hydrolase family 6 protein [Demequina mangrovi]|uniref:Glucanase n=1 Tax=Demequina mangrovi TaxID=1043493 RepID=A0A1H6W9T8_9MICO|nr:glycoside hydrolase family 6 protein [Demequina mangrovi]SEJ09322.1 cellulose 1,4-beta-cellobiosidase [Demequina mangrovi]
MRVTPGIAGAVIAVLALAGCTGGDDDPSPTPTASASDGSDATMVIGGDDHVDNPYDGAVMYVNEDWSTNVRETAGESTDAVLAASMKAVANQPTAVWLDRIAAIEGTSDARGLEAHLDAALRQAESAEDGAPVVVTLVIYDLPGRDCYALASSGELSATDADMARYREDYIDVIAEILAREEYADLRIVAVVEPDSLPNLVTNATDSRCEDAAPYYREGVVYALDSFARLGHVYSYLDAAHSGWLGWPDNAGGAVALFAEIAQETQAGFGSIDGFVTDTANTTPLEEPFLDATDTVGGQEVRNASFYETNPDIDEVSWAADLWSRATAAGFAESTGIVIDTSRNGWGGTARPTAASSSTDLETYVDESRVDRRVHRGAWCNPAGAGLGMRPEASPEGYPDAHLDAFMWVKPPGESDGSSRLIANDQGKAFDQMCDPAYESDRLGGQLTGALPDAPISGAWFPAQFAELVANAYPPVGTDVTTDGALGTPTPTLGSGACTAMLTVRDSWEGGYVADVTVTANVDVSNWSVELPAGTVVRDGAADIWGVVESGGSVSPTGWSATLAAGASATFGWVGVGDDPAAGPLVCNAS